MRLLSISGGIILAATIGVVGGTLVPTMDATSTSRATATQRDDVPRVVLQVMSWWYFNSQLSLAQLLADPAAHYVIVDLRQPEDFAHSHLPGAVNIPANQIVAQLGSVAPNHDQNILLYGYDETHSVRSLAALRLLAYTHVKHLKDGWPDSSVPTALNAAVTNHSATII